MTSISCLTLVPRHSSVFSARCTSRLRLSHLQFAVMNENVPETPIGYRIKPAVLAPLLVCGAAVVFAFLYSMWWLLAIPFAVLASFCGQPNLNLANGCLAYLSIVVGCGIAFFHRESGLAVCLGAPSSLFLSALEKGVTAKPIHPETDGNRPGQYDR